MAENSPIGAAEIRAELGLTQRDFAQLLGVSVRAVHSYEQRWRTPSPSVQRMLLLLRITHRRGTALKKLVCWKEKACAPDCRKQCIAYGSRQGHLCWFLTGTICSGTPARTWAEKWRRCSRCTFMKKLLRRAR